MKQYIIILQNKHNKFLEAPAAIYWGLNPLKSFFNKRWFYRVCTGGTWFTPFNVWFYFLMFKYCQPWYTPRIEKVPLWKIERHKEWQKQQAIRESCRSEDAATAE